jgi:dTMP kinase
MPTGVFLSLDGIDGTGKSTQARLLADRLHGLAVPVTTCADPGGTDLGAALRELLLGHRHQIGPRAEALLFMASRAELVDRVIRPALTRGEVVVSDRFLLATVVYQGHAGGLDPDDLWDIGMLATGGMVPDLTIVFDVPPEVAAVRRRGVADRFESRGDEYYRLVRQGFLAEARRRQETHVLIDAGPDVEAVHDEVWRVVAPLLVAHGHIKEG